MTIAREVGPDKFSEALVKAVRNSGDFFPSVSKIREYAGLRESPGGIGSEAAWLWVQDYLREWGSSGRGYWMGKAHFQPPAIPARIKHAVRMVGGLLMIERVTDNSLPFMRRDFMAAWDHYDQSAAAYNELQLQAPVKPDTRLLSAAPKQFILPPPETVLPRMPERRQMTDDEWQARRNLLSEQAASMLKKFPPISDHKNSQGETNDRREDLRTG